MTENSNPNPSKRRSYDFLGAAALFIVLVGGVALWATSRAPVSGGVAANSANAQVESPRASSDKSAPTVNAPLRPATPDAPVLNVPKKIAWEATYESAMTRARKEGKPVLVDFYTDWCSACKILDSEVYTQKSVIAESTRFVCVKVNAEKRPDLAGAFNVQGYPYIAVLQANVKGVRLLDALPGAMPAPEFEAWVKKARGKYSNGETAA